MDLSLLLANDLGLPDTGFYVYIYFDPSKHWDQMAIEPFYVGEGQERRVFDHLTETLKTTCNKFKVAKLNQIKRAGLKPIIRIVFHSKSMNQALRVEKRLIKFIGRRNLGKGPLTNLTDGGEGSYGWKASEQTRENQRRSSTFAPFGFTRRHNKYRRSEQEFPVLCKLHKLRQAHALPEVARVANKLGLRGRHGHKWTTKSVHKVLTKAHELEHDLLPKPVPEYTKATDQQILDAFEQNKRAVRVTETQLHLGHAGRLQAVLLGRGYSKVGETFLPGRFDEAWIKKQYDDINSATAIQSIANATGIGCSAVRKWLSKLGLSSIMSHERVNERRKVVVDMYKKQDDIKCIMRETGFSRDWITTILKQESIPLRPRYSKTTTILKQESIPLRPRYNKTQIKYIIEQTNFGATVPTLVVKTGLTYSLIAKIQKTHRHLLLPLSQRLSAQRSKPFSRSSIFMCRRLLRQGKTSAEIATVLNARSLAPGESAWTREKVSRLRTKHNVNRGDNRFGEVLKEIKRMTERHHTLHEIASYLNKTGYRTPSRRKPWSQATVSQTRNKYL